MRVLAISRCESCITLPLLGERRADGNEGVNSLKVECRGGDAYEVLCMRNKSCSLVYGELSCVVACSLCGERETVMVGFISVEYVALMSWFGSTLGFLKSLESLVGDQESRVIC